MSSINDLRQVVSSSRLADPTPSQGSTTRDILALPAYGLSEAALYLHLPSSTLANWFGSGRLDVAPVFERPGGGSLLSFYNLAEAHVLSSIRNRGVPLQRIRRAVHFMKEIYGAKHPLLEKEMEIGGKEIFVDELEVTRGGQGVMKALLQSYLERLDRNERGIVRLFPFVVPPDVDDNETARRTIVINPRISFGRPVIQGTGIPTAVLAERFQAGDTVDELSEDYGQEPVRIEDAIRFEARYPNIAA